MYFFMASHLLVKIRVVVFHLISHKIILLIYLNIFKNDQISYTQIVNKNVGGT